MPWFTRKKDEPPDPPKAPHGQKYFDTIKDQFKALIQKEAAALERLGLPIPRVQGEIRFSPDQLKNKVSWPAITFPPHLSLRVRPMPDPENDHPDDRLALDVAALVRGVSKEEMSEIRLHRGPARPPLELHQTYFITGDSHTINKAMRAFKRGGLYEVVKLIPGKWLNRDAYGLYKAICALKIDYVYDSFKDTDLGYLRVPPLRTAAAFSLDQIDQFQRRIRLFSVLTSGIINVPTIEASDLSKPLFPQVPDQLAFNIPIHQAHLTDKVVTLKILAPVGSKHGIAEQFLERLRPAHHPIAFELIAHQDTMHFQLSCHPEDQAQIEAQLQTFYSDASVIAHEPPATDQMYCLTACPKFAYHALKRSQDFSLDPYVQLFAALSDLPPTATACIQFLFAPLPSEAVKQISAHLVSLLDPNSDKRPGDQRIFRPRTPPDKPLVDARVRELEKKLPAWAVAVKLYASERDLLDKLRQDFLNQYKTSEQQWEFSDITSTQTIDRDLTAWNVVNTDELAALVHFPGKDVSCDRLETAQMKAKLPPDLYTQTGVVIGESTARGQTKTITIPDSVRDRHAYVVGKSGTGKSTLLFNAIRQDIERGSGVAVIDPHGDLVEEVMQYIPRERVEDTIYFNAADKAHPIGLNILNAQDEDEIGLLADDLLITFKRLSESWGERMENILRYSFHTLLRAEDSTFLDLKTLLQDPNYRQQVAAHTNNRMLRDFWHLEYPNYPKDAAQPILNRMSKFSLSPTLTGILSQPDSSLSFFDVIQNKKILLVNISKGQIGEDTAQLLGSLIVSQLQLAIMRRASLPKESRDPYYLYVDEFQNFTTSAFEKILSEARKYKLCLTLAHQYISQLDEKTKNAILANVGTIVMFQSYPADAQALRPELGQYEPTDVTNLNTSKHEALCKPSTQSKDTFLFQTLAPPKRPQSFAREIIEYTRENYSTTPIQYDAPREVHSPAPPTGPQASMKLPRPARALAKEFANQGDKILHYVSQAEWLATAQIHELCYSHIAEASRAPNASRDLKALVEAKRIKFQNFGKSKIYYTGRQVNPTTHNLAIRDLFSKIIASGYELAEVDFFPQLPGLTPDLAVSFLNDDGSQTKTFWEYDAGTEGIAELLKKVSRYEILGKDSLVVFVFNTKERLHQFAKAAGATRIVAAVISEFTTLDDGVFVFLQTAGGGGTASEASGLFV